jgi:hypothetical protein
MNETGLDPAAVNAAARLVAEADALLVCAGAGMGIASAPLQKARRPLLRARCRRGTTARSER